MESGLILNRKPEVIGARTGQKKGGSAMSIMEPIKTILTSR